MKPYHSKVNAKTFFRAFAGAALLPATVGLVGPQLAEAADGRLDHPPSQGSFGETRGRALQRAEETSADAPPLRFVLDMVHDNPGEPPFDTKYRDPPS